MNDAIVESIEENASLNQGGSDKFWKVMIVDDEDSPYCPDGPCHARRRRKMPESRNGPVSDKTDPFRQNRLCDCRPV